MYRQWPMHLSNDIELVAVQYPGHATRLAEAPFTQMNVLLDHLEQAITSLLDRPFALFGHGMGATVAFELTRRLQLTQQPLPQQLFVSGCSAPQLPVSKLPIHALPDQAFLDAIRTMNDIPPEVLEQSELMGIMLPILRADFQMIETWQYRPSPPFRVPISVFGGFDDPEVPTENLNAWAACTTGEMKCHLFSGDYFFLNEQGSAMLATMNRALT